MLAQPSTTKWLIHGYETCGYANVKRPMLGMPDPNPNPNPNPQA